MAYKEITTIEGITSAAPGWWALYHQEDGEDEWAPIACWVIVRSHNKEERPDLVSVDGIEPSGLGWDGSPCSEAGNFVRFEYDPERPWPTES